jgi:hypothetical protein
MSGHRRVCVPFLVLFAGLSVSPASSNSLTDWLSNPAFEGPKAQTPAECLSHPRTSAAPSRHWMYHLEGHRKCWFEAEVTASVQKQVNRHAPKRPHANEAARRKMAVMNAQDQLLIDPLPQVPRAAATDAAPEPGGGSGTPTSAVSEPLQSRMDRLTNDANPRLEDVSAAVASIDEHGRTISAAQATTAAPSGPDANKDPLQVMATRLGILAITLGLGLLFGSLLCSRFLSFGGAVRRG